MNKETLAKFEFNNKWYYIEKRKNKIVYYYICNDKEIYALSLDEENMMEDVLKAIIPSSNIVKSFNIIYKNQKYEIFLDRKTKLRIIKPNNINEDYIELSYLLNNQNEYFSDTLNNDIVPEVKNDKKFFKRIVKDRFNRIIVTFVSVAILGSSILIPKVIAEGKTNSSTDNLYVYERMIETSSLTDSEVLTSLTNAINNNTNLTDEEKMAMFSVINIIVNTKEYADLDYLENVLGNIYFQYYPETTGTPGSYYPDVNSFLFSGVHNINEVDPIVLHHELCHVLGQHSPECTNTFFVETVNTIFAEDCYDEVEDTIYKYYYNYTKMLMEIIGVEPFIKFQYYNDERIITNALCNIIDDEERAQKLIENICKFETLYKLLGLVRNDPSFKYEIYDLHEIVCEELNNYYKAKYNRDMSDDLLMTYYMSIFRYKSRFEDEIIKMTNVDDIDVDSVKTKKCFVSGENDYELMLIVGGEPFYINESNRYLENSNDITR